MSAAGTFKRSRRSQTAKYDRYIAHLEHQHGLPGYVTELRRAKIDHVAAVNAHLDLRDIMYDMIVPGLDETGEVITLCLYKAYKIQDHTLAWYNCSWIRLEKALDQVSAEALMSAPGDAVMASIVASRVALAKKPP